MSAPLKARRCVTSVEQAEQLAAAGEITVGDLDEVRTFAAFLEDRAAGTPLAEAYAKHYPDQVPS